MNHIADIVIIIGVTCAVFNTVIENTTALAKIGTCGYLLLYLLERATP